MSSLEEVKALANEKIKGDATIDILGYAGIALLVICTFMSVIYWLSSAGTWYEKIVAIALGATLPVISSLMLSIVIWLWEIKAKSWAAYAAFLLLLIALWEVSTTIGYLGNTNSSAANSSRVSQLHERRLLEAENKINVLSLYSGVNINAIEASLGAERDMLESAVSRLNECPPNFAKNCKKIEIKSIAKAKRVIRELELKLEGGRAYSVAITTRNTTENAVMGNDVNVENAKVPEGFKMMSRFMYGDISKAKLMQSSLVLFMGFLVVLLDLSIFGIRTRLVLGDKTDKGVKSSPTRFSSINETADKFSNTFGNEYGVGDMFRNSEGMDYGKKKVSENDYTQVIKEVVVEVPVEVIKEVPVEVPVEVIKEVPVEVIKKVVVGGVLVTCAADGCNVEFEKRGGKRFCTYKGPGNCKDKQAAVDRKV